MINETIEENEFGGSRPAFVAAETAAELPSEGAADRENGIRESVRNPHALRSALGTLSALLQSALLVAAAVVAWTGNLFVGQGGPVSPLTGAAVSSFALFDRIGEIVSYLTGTFGAAGELLAASDISGQVAVIADLLPAVFFWICTAVFVVVLSLAAAGSVLSLCLLLGRRQVVFARSFGWTLALSLAEILAGGFLGLGAPAFSSAVVQCAVFSAGGLLVCGFSNALFHGRWTAGGVVRFIGRAGMLAGGIVSLAAYPMSFTCDFTGGGSQAASALVLAFDAPSFVTVGMGVVIAFCTVMGLLSVPSFIRRSAVGLVRGTRGKEMKRAAVFLFGRLLTAVVLGVYVSLLTPASSLSANVYVSVVGGAIAFAFSVVCGLAQNKK